MCDDTVGLKDETYDGSPSLIRTYTWNRHRNNDMAKVGQNTSILLLGSDVSFLVRTKHADKIYSKGQGFFSFFFFFFAAE